MDTNLALRKFLLSLRVERNYSSATSRAYGIDLREFSNYLTQKNIALRKADRWAIRAYLAELRMRPLSRNTLLRKWASLRSFFKYLKKTNEVEKNPCLTIATPRREKTVPNFL